MIGPINPGDQFFTSIGYGYTPTQPGVRLIDSAGNTTTARSTAGIINLGGSARGKLLTAPSTQGWYQPEWDDNDGERFPDDPVWVSSILSDILAGGGGGGGGGLSPAPIVLPAGGVSPVVTQTFFIKRGDNEPLVFAITELDTTGAQRLLDVTGWTGKFKMRAAADVGTVLINQNFYISDPNGVVTTNGTYGLIAYGWPNAGETDREGLFLCEFETHSPSGVKKTYPTTSDVNNEYIKAYFVPDLDDAGSH